MPSRPEKAPVVGIIGAGRVGCALGTILRSRGWRIGAVVARSRRGAATSVRAIGVGKPWPIKPLTPMAEAVSASDLVLIATPDAAIASVARDLAKATDSWRGKIVLHTCGVLDHRVLRPLELRGAGTGSFHPLQTFGRGRVPRLDGIACAIEGTPAAVRMARRLCREFGCIPIRVPRGSKPAYHAAAVLAAGHVLGVVEAAVRILVTVGFTRRQAVRALLPLTRQTLANFESMGAVRSWTGPAARGDRETIARHMAALRRFPREYRAVYAALTRLSVSLLSRNPRTAVRRLGAIGHGSAAGSLAGKRPSGHW